MTRIALLIAAGMLVICCRVTPRNEVAFADGRAPAVATRSKAERDAQLDAMLRLMARAEEIDRDGRHADSEPLVREVLLYFQRVGDQQLVAALHAQLGMLLEAQGRTLSAREHYLAAVDTIHQLEQRQPLERDDRDVLATATRGAERTN